MCEEKLSTKTKTTSPSHFSLSSFLFFHLFSYVKYVLYVYTCDLRPTCQCLLLDYLFCFFTLYNTPAALVIFYFHSFIVYKLRSFCCTINASSIPKKVTLSRRIEKRKRVSVPYKNFVTLSQYKK